MDKSAALKKTDPEVFGAIEDERRRQNDGIELIASENFVSPAVLEAAGSVMTNKYAEGYPGRRYYGGCEFMDVAESLARERARALFGAEHANVQPHSGTQANSAVYFAALKPGDTLMGMDLSCGGHLTHGHPLSISGKYFNAAAYGVNRETEEIDFDEVRALAKKHRPKIIVVGASAYSRIIDFEKFRAVADEVGALVMADIAHIAGLVATGLHPSPVPFAEFVTTTTHKTLRGPRGGMVLCRESWAKEIDRAVFPGLQGGPLMHVIAAKAVCFKEAAGPEFRAYQEQIIKNTRAMAAVFAENGFRIVSGGTDNHLFLADVFKKGVTGKDAEAWLGAAHITVNKNTIPYDTQKPLVASGIRVGSPAIATRGMKEPEARQIAAWMCEVLDSKGDARVAERVGASVKELARAFPIYS
jgi:glycine hydroxymethyltransferase